MVFYKRRPIRWATYKDVGVLARLEQECYPDNPWPEGQIHRRLSHPDVGCLVATVGRQIVGYLMLKIRQHQRTVVLFRLGVDPLHRRLGWGRQLVHQAVHNLSVGDGRHEPQVVKTLVHERNLRGQQLARSLGFRLEYTMAAFFHPDDAYVFRLDLAPAQAKTTLGAKKGSALRSLDPPATISLDDPPRPPLVL